MPADAPRSLHEVREAVRRYLDWRPDAADTLIGIAQWWLPESMRDISMDRLRLALIDLVAARHVRRTILPDGTEIYSRAEDETGTADPNETR